MSNSLYWNVYKALERELLDLADTIHIDDSQFSVYSMKIANLLIRTVIEVESISKELYFREGGKKTDDNNLYFDTDCIAFLEEKWKLSKKIVMVSNPTLYLHDKNHLCFTPLHKAFKRGTSASSWQKAYQAVKHNRTKSLKLGNVNHFVQALGALYLLNLYYKDQSVNLGENFGATDFDASLGSSIFSIEVHPFLGVSLNEEYQKRDNFEECTYFISPTDESDKSMKSTLEEINSKCIDNALSRVTQKINHDIKESKEGVQVTDLQKRVEELFAEYQTEGLNAAIEDNKYRLYQSFMKGKYIATLNKHQY